MSESGGKGEDSLSSDEGEMFKICNEDDLPQFSLTTRQR